MVFQSMRDDCVCICYKGIRHGLISGTTNVQQLHVFTVCSYEYMQQAHFQSTVIRNREVGYVHFFSLWGSVSLLPKPSAWSGAFHLMYSAICEVKSSQCATSDEFQSILWQRGVRSKPLRQKLREIVPRC